MQGVIGVVLVVAIVAALLGFMAAVMLTCIAMAKTRLVTIFGYVVIGVLALVALLSVLLSVVPGRGYWW
jgi:hypothetical protein